jgi:hypothetical protein
VLSGNAGSGLAETVADKMLIVGVCPSAKEIVYLHSFCFTLIASHSLVYTDRSSSLVLSIALSRFAFLLPFIQSRYHGFSPSVPLSLSCGIIFLLPILFKGIAMTTKLNSTTSRGLIFSRTALRAALALVCLLGFGLASCRRDDNPAGPVAQGADVIMPLKIGNTWTYQGQVTVSVPNSPISIPPIMLSSTVRIVGERTYKGEQCFTASVTATTAGSMIGMIMIPGIMQTDSVAYLNKSDGLYGANLSGGGAWQRSVPFPAAVNSTWTLPDTTTTSGGGARVTLRNIRLTVASVNASVTVPAGTFTCYQYKLSADIEVNANGMTISEKDAAQGTLSYAVNKGMIKTEQTVRIQESTQTVSLSLQSISLP